MYVVRRTKHENEVPSTSTSSVLPPPVPPPTRPVLVIAIVAVVVPPVSLPVGLKSIPARRGSTAAWAPAGSISGPVAPPDFRFVVYCSLLGRVIGVSVDYAHFPWRKNNGGRTAQLYDSNWVALVGFVIWPPTNHACRMPVNYRGWGCTSCCVRTRFCLSVLCAGSVTLCATRSSRLL